MLAPFGVVPVLPVGLIEVMLPLARKVNGTGVRLLYARPCHQLHRLL